MSNKNVNIYVNRQPQTSTFQFAIQGTAA